MKIVVVNSGPRKGWNTDTLLTSNAPDNMYRSLLQNYQKVLSSWAAT